MGVLDDAIRDHLELKRKHGASDEEIEREEAEALGPARRDFDAPAEQGSGDDETGFEAAEPLAEEPVVDDRLADDRLTDEPLRDEPPAGEPLEQDALQEQPLEDEPVDDRPVDEDPLSRHPLEEEPLDEEFPEAELPEDEPQGFGDETPEHERLWSEERPRRDFDFD
jgi:hypothetical protein